MYRGRLQIAFLSSSVYAGFPVLGFVYYLLVQFLQICLGSTVISLLVCFLSQLFFRSLLNIFLRSCRKKF